jgi:phage-related protein
MQDTTFIIDGVNSSDIGVSGISIIRLDGGLVNTPFIGGREIVEDRIPYRDIPTFYKTTKNPIEFTLKFSLLDDEFTEEHRFQIAKLFGGDTYKSFQSTDYLGRIFYVICTNQADLYLTGKRGYFELNLRTSAPYSFSIPEVSTFDLSDIISPTTIMLENRSNVMHSKLKEYYYEPEVWIDLKSTSTGVRLTNTSDSNRIFEFTGLNLLEEIYVNNSLKQIQSNTGLNRLSKLTNHNFLRLAYGQNLITVNNKCVIQVKSEFPLYI